MNEKDLRVLQLLSGEYFLEGAGGYWVSKREDFLLIEYHVNLEICRGDIIQGMDPGDIYAWEVSPGKVHAVAILKVFEDTALVAPIIPMGFQAKGLTCREGWSKVLDKSAFGVVLAGCPVRLKRKYAKKKLGEILKEPLNYPSPEARLQSLEPLMTWEENPDRIQKIYQRAIKEIWKKRK